MKALVINCTVEKSPAPSPTYDRVAGVVVTGNEDGAHHVTSGISGARAEHPLQTAG